MYEVHDEIVVEEERVEKIWQSTEGKKIMADAVARAKKILAETKK